MWARHDIVLWAAVGVETHRLAAQPGGLSTGEATDISGPSTEDRQRERQQKGNCHERQEASAEPAWRRVRLQWFHFHCL